MFCPQHLHYGAGSKTHLKSRFFWRHFEKGRATCLFMICVPASSKSEERNGHEQVLELADDGNSKRAQESADDD